MVKPAVVEVRVADLPQVQAALAEAKDALESQRRTLLAAVRGSCACAECKTYLTGLLTPADHG
jgi:hypothetical protein